MNAIVSIAARFLADTATTAAATAQQDAGSSWLALLPNILLIAVLFVAMYFLMIRPQRKRQKEEQQMRNSLRVGYEITTIGGICGRVLQIKEESIVIETGADRSKMTIKKWAIQSCDTVHDAADDDDDDDDDV